MRVWGVYSTIMLVCVCLLGTPAPLFAALKPSVNTQQNRDFTRVTFGWPKNVRFQVNPYKGAVILKFSEPADIDLAAIKAGLGDKVTGASMSVDKTSVTIRFDQPYRIRHFVSGNSNGIDILGTKPLNAPVDRPTPPPTPPAPAPEKTPTPAPVAQPQPAAQPAPAAQAQVSPAEPAQASTTAPVAQAVPPTQPTPPAATVATTPPASQPVAPAPATTAPPVAAPEVATTQPAAAQTTTPAVTAPASPTEPQPQVSAAETPPPPPPPAANTTAQPEASVAAPAEAAIEPTPPPATDATAQPEAAAIAPVAATEPIAEPSTKSEEQPQATAPANPDPFAAPETSPAGATTEPSPSPEPTATSAPVPLSAPPATPQAPTAEALNAAKAALVEESQAPAPAPASPATPAGEPENLLITSKSLPTGTDIIFPWIQRTAAAVFNRGDDVWIIFSAPSKINLKLLEGIMPASVTQVESIETPGHTVLRLRTDGTLFPKVAQIKNSQNWVISLSTYHQIAPRPIAMTANTNVRKFSLFMPILEYTPPITLTDPVVGDEILVAPFYGVGEGIYPPRRFVEAEVLESAQGLAVVKKADLTEIRPIRNGLRIANYNGMSLSSNLPAIASEELEALQNQQNIWFPYDKWKVDPEQLVATRQEIEQKLIGATPVRANSLRLKLAQMYLAEGLGFETIALLDIIKASDPVFYTERKLASMHGAANFMSDRFAEAAADFSSEELEDAVESTLWNEALSVLQVDRPRFNYLEYHRDYISHYPPALREKLAILAADNYINRKSFSKAFKVFDGLSETGISPRLMPYVDFLLGKISAETKNYDAATKLWEPLTTHDGDNFVRARAEFSLVSMLYTQGRIGIKEALDRLDRLRIVWRGDSLEQSLLSYLGQLYIDNGDYLEGLRAWRELLTNFPDSPLASSITREMAVIFNKLFTEGEADKLKPLQALSIFYEFRELTPVGEAGDTMIQGLATRLANVDLLDRAAALLEHQIKFRQERGVRSKLGAQLGLVYLLNREPKKALKALQLTNYGKNPKALKLKRLQLTAMALSEIGKPERAIEMLSPDTSKDADILRLNIFWKMRNWKEVIGVAESLLSDRDDLTRPLTAQETDYLLQLAIAYMFESDTVQLTYLRDYFGSLVAKGPNKEIFDFVTDASGPIDHEKIDEVSKQVSRIENFMSTYRARVNERGLSSAVN